MAEHKFASKYTGVYDRFSSHCPINFVLDYIDEIYLPFWACRQEIYIQREPKTHTTFQKILLGLVARGVRKHVEISAFLGVKEDDFCLSQLDYLLNRRLLEEHPQENESAYVITDKGRDLLSNENPFDEDTIEPAEVEYGISDLNFIAEEKYQRFYGDFTVDPFTKGTPFDDKSCHNFSGYKLIEAHKLEQGGAYPEEYIPHKNKPIFSRIRDSKFIEFYNKKRIAISYEHGKLTNIFHDFGSPKIEVHKLSIKFCILVFRNNMDPSDLWIEIRHCEDSVLKFDEKRLTLEETLSLETLDYIKENDSLLAGLMDRARLKD